MFGRNSKISVSMFREKKYNNSGQINIIQNVSDKELEFSNELIDSINTIENDYIKNMSDKNYENIPNDYIKYLKLYDNLDRAEKNTKNNNLLKLLNTTKGSLKNAIETNSVFMQNKSLQSNYAILENRMNDIISKKNEQATITDTKGKISLEKTFDLAPLYKNYIEKYGLPLEGEGFDSNKLLEIIQELESQGINPYNSTI